MTTLDTFKLDTGYYDEGAILEAAGVEERNARFAAIFGDAQGKNAIATDWQALLDEARRLNTAMLSEARQVIETEARALVAQPEPWNLATWRRLVELRYATKNVDGNGELPVFWQLTEAGERLLNPNYQSPGLYDDQVGIDG